MSEYIVINIGKDFAKVPGLRFKSSSDHSGEEFYERILNPKFKEALGAKKEAFN